MSAPLPSALGPRRRAGGEKVEAPGRRKHAAPVLYGLTVAVVALAYYAVGRLGLELGYLHGAGAAPPPPGGPGRAGRCPCGSRLWPAIVLGDLLLGDYSTPLGTVLAQTLGNTVALVAAA